MRQEFIIESKHGIEQLELLGMLEDSNSEEEYAISEGSFDQGKMNKQQINMVLDFLNKNDLYVCEYVYIDIGGGQTLESIFPDDLIEKLKEFDIEEVPEKNSADYYVRLK